MVVGEQDIEDIIKEQKEEVKEVEVEEEIKYCAV
jgi:hypothetical protein